MGDKSRLVGSAIVTRCRVLLIPALLLLAACAREPVARLQPLETPGTEAAGAGAREAKPAPSAAAAGKQTAPGEADPAKKTASRGKNVAVIRVYYATDRSRTALSAPHKIFGNARGTLSYGSCEVSVPINRRSGSHEAVEVARLEFQEAPPDYPSLRKVSPREYDAYLEGLRAVIAKSAKKSAFVFVHGYNVSFASAARRTAQLKYDLGFDGAPIFFSWPSKGRADSFTADEADVEWAQPDLKEFLKELAGNTKVKNIYLIAHGMGNRALAKAYIYLISERPELKKMFREVILVAPDIDSDLFKRDIAPALAASATRTTLYSSSRDLALRAATKFQNYPRAGDSGANLLLLEGIETIDASSVNTALMRNPRLSGENSLVSDLYYLIRDGKRPAERTGLRTMNATSGQYWRFKAR
jgi:esterase/lipase superfamily enzyme